jgi:hypothetical protein
MHLQKSNLSNLPLCFSHSRKRLPSLYSLTTSLSGRIALSTRFHPVRILKPDLTALHTYNFTDGKIENVHAPPAIAFAQDEETIYGTGTQKVEAFDVETGSQQNIRVHERGRLAALKVKHAMIAVGSYAKEIGLYDQRDAERICGMKEGVGAVTQVMHIHSKNVQKQSRMIEKNEDMIFKWNWPKGYLPC